MESTQDTTLKHRFFITGGSGFYGINMIRYLLEKGHDIVSYDLLPFDYPEKDKITWIVGDIRNFDFLKKSMEGCDIVIHAAAALPLYTKEDIFTTDIDGSRNVVRAAYELGIKRVVHISSTAVYGIPDHHPLLENDRLIGVGPYGHAKIEAEKMCIEYRDKGMIIPVIRPKSFVGPERLGVFALFYDFADTGHHFPMLGSGNNRYQLLDVEDLCVASYTVATSSDPKVNDTFNIGAKDFKTMKEDYQYVLDYAGYGKKIFGLPAAPAIWTLRILEVLKISPLYKWVYETASKDSFVSIEKAEKTFGYAPKYSNQDALLRNYKWYIENKNNFKGEAGVTHRVPWKQGILSLAKLFF
jgi:nucleoside-diphosphate-sugar epimerase